MFLLLPCILLGIAAGFVRRGSLSRLAQLPLRFGWLIILSFLIQWAIFSTNLESNPFIAEATPLLHVASLLLLLVAVGLNLTIPAMPVVAFGLLLNFLVIVTNGGYMPVAPEVLVQVGQAKQVEEMRASGHLSKGTLLLPETRLPFLADIFVLPTPLTREKVFSLGDVLIGLGALLLVEESMVRASQRSTA